MSELDECIVAWRQSLESVLAVGQTLVDSDWNSPTECPGWSVKDIYSHLVGGEVWMAAGHPRPDQGLARITAEPVAARQHTSPTAVLSELRTVYGQRCTQIAASPPDPEQPAFTGWGQPVPLATLWRHRAFDVWVHEQDIRRAVGQPGNLDSPGALIACGQFCASLPLVVAKRAAASPGSLVRFSIDGPVTFEHSVMVGEDGRGRLVTATDAEATCVLNLGWESFARLGCGRISPESADARVTGDLSLGHRVLAQLSITP